MKTKLSRRALLLALLPAAVIVAYALKSTAGSAPLAPPANAVPTTVIVAAAHTFETKVRVSGEVTATHGSPAVVAEAAGKVAGVGVAVGDPVHAGQLLAWLEPVDAQTKLREAQADAARLQAQWSESRRQAAEQLLLADKDFVSRSELERYKTQETSAYEMANAAKARLDAARAGAARMGVYAPYSGTVANRKVQAGNYVRAGDTLFELSQPGATELTFHVPESAVDLVTTGSLARVLVGAHPVSTMVTRVQPTIDPQSRSFRAFTPNPTPDQLKLGRSVTAQLVTRTIEAIAVPEAALVLEGENLSVFVIRDNQAHKRAVTRVSQRGGLLGVEGLTPGERIAVSGAAFLRDGAEVAP